MSKLKDYDILDIEAMDDERLEKIRIGQNPSDTCLHQGRSRQGDYGTESI